MINHPTLNNPRNSTPLQLLSTHTIVDMGILLIYQ